MRTIKPVGRGLKYMHKNSENSIRMNSNSFASKAILCITNGYVYSSIKEAAGKLNISRDKIRDAAHGLRDDADGLIFKFKQ